MTNINNVNIFLNYKIVQKQKIKINVYNVDIIKIY